jgi:hypothetical protein
VVGFLQLEEKIKLGVPLAFVKTQARVGSTPSGASKGRPSGLGLRPRAATALWPTGPGPGGIPLWRDLQSGLTQKANTQLPFLHFTHQWRSCGRKIRGEDESAFPGGKCFTISIPLFRSPLEAAATSATAGRRGVPRGTRC